MATGRLLAIASNHKGLCVNMNVPDRGSEEAITVLHSACEHFFEINSLYSSVYVSRHMLGKRFHCIYIYRAILYGNRNSKIKI